MTGAEVPELQPLRGFTVAVTAARRREELMALLERRGARVVCAPTIRIVPLPDDRDLLAATHAALRDPVDVTVATTAIGFRAWLEAADGWGVGERLRRHLGSGELVARGPKVRGALRAAGLQESWSPSSESRTEVLEHLTARDLRGTRVVLQLHGEPLPEAVETLLCAGAEVVAVPVYRWTLPDDVTPVHRLVQQVVGRQVDAVTFTSAPAVAALLQVARTDGVEHQLLDALRTDVVPVCVGPVCAGPLERRGVPVPVPDRARLGNLVRLVVDELPPRRTRQLSVAGHTVLLRGHAVVVDGRPVDLPPAPMAVLRALASRPGTVLTRTQLAPLLPGGHAGPHAVESAVMRLRALLGDPRVVQTVVKRGYRLACDPQPGRDAPPERRHA